MDDPIEQGPGFIRFAVPRPLSMEEIFRLEENLFRGQFIPPIQPPGFFDNIHTFTITDKHKAFGHKILKAIVLGGIIKGAKELRKIARYFIDEPILAYQEVAESLKLEKLGFRTFISDLREEDPGLFSELGLLSSNKMSEASEKRAEFLQRINDEVTRLYNINPDHNAILSEMSKSLYGGEEMADLSPGKMQRLHNLVGPVITGLVNANAAGTEAAGTDATQPDPEAKTISEYLEALRAQRESDEKDDKVRKLLIGQKQQMANNNERSPDQWLARAQALRQDLASRPIHSKSNYELITAGLVQIPYYSTKVQQ